MTEILREVLFSWADSWRHPNLASLLARVVRGGFDDCEAADALIADIAVPRGPREAVATLIKLGEFGLVEDLLARGEGRTGLPAATLVDISDELTKARRRARDEIRARVVSLKGRASHAGAAATPPPGLDQAIDDRKAGAEMLLDGWESSIRHAEAELAWELQALLEGKASQLGLTGPDLDSWRTTVERCVEAREFDTARLLLKSGPAASPGDDPLAIPRRPYWPWNEPLSDVLGWFQGRPAPADFAPRWQVAVNDTEANALIAALQEVVSGGIPDAARAVRFATALDAFLGATGDRPRPALRRGDGFETRLTAPADPRLPCLARRDGSGVGLWLPLSPVALPPEVEPGDDLLLCFFPEHTTVRRGTLAFDARVLLRLMADRNHRLLNFLRELGGRVPMADVVPPDQVAAKLAAGEASALRAYTRRLFDVVNVVFEGPELADVLVYYAGGRADLLLLLVRVLLAALPSRQTPLRPDDLTRAWLSPEFREAAVAELLRPIESTPRDQATLGAVRWACPRPGDEVSPADVCYALEMLCDAKEPELLVRESLVIIAHAGLIEGGPPPAPYRSPQSGIGDLLLDAIPDPEAYTLRAFDRPNR